MSIRDRWRFFWNKPDVIRMENQRRMGAARRPLNKLELLAADNMTRQALRAERGMTRAERAVARQHWMERDRAARLEIRDMSRAPRRPPRDRSRR